MTLILIMISAAERGGRGGRRQPGPRHAARGGRAALFWDYFAFDMVFFLCLFLCVLFVCFLIFLSSVLSMFSLMVFCQHILFLTIL